MTFSSQKPQFGPAQKRMKSTDLESVVADEYAALLSAVFGDSDTDVDSNDQICTEEVGSESNDEYFWEKVQDVEGLWHCSSFLSLKQQESLLEAIDSEGWFCDPLHNQAMRFGDLPLWAKDLSTLIQSRSGLQSSVECLESQAPDQDSEKDGPEEVRESTSLFPGTIREREPLFDQMIVNLYQPGEGIAAHVDLLRFEDGIAIVSLESSCVMSFRIVTSPSDGVVASRSREPTLDRQYCCPGDGSDGFDPDTKEMPHSRPIFCEQLKAPGIIPQTEVYNSSSVTSERDPKSGVAKRVDVLLSPGDLIIAYGPARYSWTHEINRGKDGQLWNGQLIAQRRRVSVTLRKLCPPKDV